MSESFQHIGIIGGGAWGTALAMAMCRAGRDALLWVHEPDVADAINGYHQNRTYLPNVKLDPGIKATTKLSDLGKCDVLLLVTPAQHSREVCRQLSLALGAARAPIVVCAKGIEQKTHKLLGDVVSEELLGHPLAILSGPSFAIEVAQDKPTALTFATKDAAFGEKLIGAIGAGICGFIRPMMS